MLTQETINPCFLGSLGPVTNSQPHLPHRTFVTRIFMKREGTVDIFLIPLDGGIKM